MVRARYILETRDGYSSGFDIDNNFQQRFLLPLVNSVQFSRNHAVTSHWTLGKKVVHQYAGIRGQRVVLRGRSGVQPRFETNLSGPLPVAGEVDQSGPAIFRRLERFIEDYENNLAKTQREFPSSKTGYMVLRMLWEGRSYSCEPMEFTWDRAAGSSTVSYEWSLVLETHGEIIDEYDGGSMLAALQEKANKVNVVTQALNGVSNALAQATELVEDGKSVLDTFREPLRALRRVGSQARKFIRADNSLRRWPQAFLQDFWYAVSEITIAMFDSWSGLPFVPRQAARPAMIAALRATGQARRLATTALGLNAVTLESYQPTTFLSQTGQATRTVSRGLTQAIKPDVSGGWASKNDQLLVVHTVAVGESLQDIAEKYTGERSNWTQIVALNDMSGVDTLSAGNPLVAGTALVVPSVLGAAGVSSTSTPGDLYGTDLRLGPDGDLVLLGNPKDIQTVSGEENLRQALTNRFLTVKGDNATFPAHGLPRLVSIPASTDRLADAAIDIEEQIRAESRIAAIDGLSIVDEGDTLLVTSVLRPILGRSFDIAVPFPAAP